MAALTLLGFLFPLVFLALIVLVIAVLVGGRGDPDLTGRRPYAIYLAIVTFVGLVASLGAAFALVKAVTDTILVGGGSDLCPPGAFDCFEPEPFGGGGGSGARDVIEAALVLAAAGTLTYLHGRKLLELRAVEPGSSSASARVLVVFGYAVSFVTVFAVLGAVVAALSALVNLVDPEGSFGGGRDQALSTLLSSLALAALTGWLFLYTWRTFELGMKSTTPVAPPPPTGTI